MEGPTTHKASIELIFVLTLSLGIEKVFITSCSRFDQSYGILCDLSANLFLFNVSDHFAKARVLDTLTLSLSTVMLSN